MTDNLTRIDDLVHFTLREWSRLSYSVTEAETERAKAQLKASILLSLDGTTAVAEDIGRQIVTTGRRMSPDEVERVVGAISSEATWLVTHRPNPRERQGRRAEEHARA